MYQALLLSYRIPLSTPQDTYIHYSDNHHHARYQDSCFSFTALVAAAAALISTEQLAANLGVSPSDLSKLLSATDVSSLDITKYTKALETLVDSNPDGRTRRSVKRQESNREKVQKEVDDRIAQYRSEHEADHGRRLAGCPSSRCGVCATGLTVAYVAGLTACGAAAVTEEAVSAGTLTPVALTQLGACVALAHSTYAGGWTFCLGMTD
ncbi:hypothetical protein FALBO_11591 [Fusarium albosuccineum]|uniref:Multiprotein-bridging factor 1 n=1 Tax=Fusarium albosuccineum TaxID=1237068 RepID=A0A8H4P3Y3_9HYPO|nr:hypothetical protein FALBO_11591 [Fusarium albosuccineum]